jgi:hypothetical protein
MEFRKGCPTLFLFIFLFLSSRSVPEKKDKDKEERGKKPSLRALSATQVLFLSVHRKRRGTTNIIAIN